LHIFSHNQSSEGSKELAKALGIKRIKKEGESKVRGGPDRKIINWGSGSIPPELANGGTTIFNPPAAVQQMANKLHAFNLLEGHCRLPPWTPEYNTARSWVEKGAMVFARTTLNGHSGNGIHIMDPEHPDTWDVRASLFTKYVKKRHEFRIHVCRNRQGEFRVIHQQMKGLKRDADHANTNHLIRNLANGFIFVINDIAVPQDVIDQSLAAMRRSGLHFGAVDVIWNEKQGQAYVLEINTAPGLVGTTIEAYARALRELQ
jgi:hypothetical protein